MKNTSTALPAKLKYHKSSRQPKTSCIHAQTVHCKLLRLAWWLFTVRHLIDWLSIVLRLHQHNIGYTADGFYSQAINSKGQTCCCSSSVAFRVQCSSQPHLGTLTIQHISFICKYEISGQAMNSIWVYPTTSYRRA